MLWSLNCATVPTQTFCAPITTCGGSYTCTSCAVWSEHPSAFVIADSLDHLRINNDQAEDDEIGNIQANVMALVANLKGRLLLEGDATQPELDDQRVLVRFFVQPVTKLIQHGHCSTDNREDLSFVQNLLVGREERFLPSPEFVFLRVHSWFHPNC